MLGGLAAMLATTGLAVTDVALAPSAAAAPASIALVKSASITQYSAPGTPVTYSYLVTNTGRVTLTSVGVSDTMTGLSPIICASSTLTPGASESCTATYTTTQADVDTGKLKNTGTAVGTPPTGPVVSASSVLTIPARQNASIGIAKSADISGFSAAGTSVNYTYVVTNTGNVTLTSVGVTDAMPGLSAVTCPSTNLAPVGTETCTSSYTTTQADVDSGGITNTGVATGTPLVGPSVSATSTLSISSTQTPAITLNKSANTTHFSAPGVPVTYSYLVTNTGNLTLSAVGVTDTMPGLSLVDCPDSTLAPTASETCTAMYTTTQADVDAGGITNDATAAGTPPSGFEVSASDSLTIPSDQIPSISVVKAGDIVSFSAPGTAIHYGYLVTNTGNVTLSSVGVTDPMPGLSAVSCPTATLAPAASESCTATYSTTQADVDAGGVGNVGTASGTSPSATVVTGSDSAFIPAVQTPSITLAKQASIGSFSAVGTPITYSYVVTNTGNVTLSSVGVTDPMPGLSAANCPTATLAPAAAETCTATYATTQADLDAGLINNTGTASGTPPVGPAVTDSASASVQAIQQPSLTVAKFANVGSFSTPGTPIIYSYVVTNTGNVTLTSVGVTDPMPGLSAVSCPSAMLAPGSAETCTATYATTQADLDAGLIANTGTASGTSPSGAGVNASGSTTVEAVQRPSISIAKSASIGSFAAPGIPITYLYFVTNDGNVTLGAVHVTDPMPGLSAVSCPTATLPPGFSENCTATYSTTQADIDAGGITNTGTAWGTPPSGTTITATSSLIVHANQNPAVGMLKEANVSSFSAAGTPISYMFLVTNSGNSTLTGIKVTDPMPGLSKVHCPTTTLAPGASETCTASYTTTQGDVDTGFIRNAATVSASPGHLAQTVPLVIPAIQAPSISVSKSANVSSFSAAGTPITYGYLVTNSGNVTLNGVNVTDPMPGLSAVSCPSATLAPGASETCTATYSTSQADVDNGFVANRGTATGTPPFGPPTMASDPLVIPAVQQPSITVAKAANVSTYAAPNDPITYGYLVTNTGNVTLTSVHVTDPMAGLSAISCPTGTLAPAASETCTALYSVAQSDLDAGSITNTGTATGTPLVGPEVTGSSTLLIQATETPSISVSKSANVGSFSAPGTPITYRYLVTNTGNLTLTSVGVTDPMPNLSPVSCPAASLAPGATETCHATYTTTQADLDLGHISNTGTASGTPPTGPAVTGSDGLTIPSTQRPSISVVKSARNLHLTAVGNPVLYVYSVTNTGNVTLTSVGVTDPMPGLSTVSCPSTTLAPGNSEECTASYQVTQADLDAGQITNTGTASGTPPTGPAVTGQDTLSIRTIQLPSISLAKSANVGSFAAPGTPITYRYLVTNTGNVTLTTIQVADPMTGLSAVSCPTTTLGPAASETCTATYATTQADLDLGHISNTGTVDGSPPIGSDVTGQGSLTIPAAAHPSITIAKTGSVASFHGAGAPITYTYRVTNTGNVTLTPVTVSDPMPGLSPVSCPAAPLAPGATATCTASYSTTLADVIAGQVANTGTASATPPSGAPVTATASLRIPFVAPACYVGPWPTQVTGYPVLPGQAAPPKGAFIGVDNNSWTIFTHNAAGSNFYSGTLTTSGTFANVGLLKAEHDDSFKMPNSHTITFRFLTAENVDGIQFTTSCGSSVTLSLQIKVKAGVIPLPPSMIFLGFPTTTASASPLTFIRRY